MCVRPSQWQQSSLLPSLLFLFPFFLLLLSCSPSPFPPFLKSTGRYLCDEYPQACTHMEGSKEECHCTYTSCEGGERKRGVDILKVPLSGLIPVQRGKCVCVRVFNMSEHVLQEGGSLLRAVIWVLDRQTQYNSSIAHMTAATKRYRRLARVSHEQTLSLEPRQLWLAWVVPYRLEKSRRAFMEIFLFPNRESILKYSLSVHLQSETSRQKQQRPS